MFREIRCISQTPLTTFVDYKLKLTKFFIVFSKLIIAQAFKNYKVQLLHSHISQWAKNMDSHSKITHLLEVTWKMFNE